MNSRMTMKMCAVTMMSVLLFRGAGVAGQASPGSSIETASGQAKIAEMKAKVTKDPKDRMTWIRLGNLYFDSGNHKEAVEAYQKALDLKANDPDVLCDQGIMYDQLGDGVRAVENFEKALAINPKHLQSLYNAGRVANERLKQPSRTLHYWKRLIQIDPTNPNVQPIKSFVEQLEKDLEALKGDAALKKEVRPAPADKEPAIVPESSSVKPPSPSSP